jgi:hypothetical protein
MSPGFTFKVISGLMRLLRRERYTIGRKGEAYLTRWVLLGKRKAGAWRLFLHCFHRSDFDKALHDHPWSFVSLVLWPGSWEHTWEGVKWYGPLSLLRRRARWAHRVEIEPGRLVWTLVLSGRYERKWGFWCPRGWTRWEEDMPDTDPCGEGVRT